MKILSRYKAFILASTALVMFLAANSVEAFVINWKTPAIGITDAETMRVNVSNVGTSPRLLPYIEISGPDGDLLAQFNPTESVMPGKGVSFDLPRDLIRDGGGRLELSANIVIGNPEMKSLSTFLDSVRLTVEILDDATGKVVTFVAIGDTNIFSAK
jgi:hypothetical protein